MEVGEEGVVIVEIVVAVKEAVFLLKQLLLDYVYQPNYTSFPERPSVIQGRHQGQHLRPKDEITVSRPLINHLLI